MISLKCQKGSVEYDTIEYRGVKSGKRSNEKEQYGICQSKTVIMKKKMMPKKKTLYEDLEIDKESTGDQIKKAFRKKAKQTHPDNGGKSEEFRTIVRAYDILSDEDKRKRYDNGENPDYIDQSNTREQQVLSIVFGIFNNIVDQNIDLVHHNLFDLMRQTIRANQQNFKTEKERNQNNIKRYNNILKRINKKDQSVLFIQLLDDKIKGCNAVIIHLDENINMCDEALKLIEQCEYETDYPQHTRFQYTSTVAGW